MGYYAFVVDAPDLCISDVFRTVEICRSKDLRFVSGAVNIRISLVIDFELTDSKESDIACCHSLYGVD
ncbi:hypothetical protein A2U01_0011532, partial [Trifolium medium]|nr:hypothetical protein [Trifolium medium]